MGGWKRKAGCDENCVPEDWVPGAVKEERLRLKTRETLRGESCLQVEERHLDRAEREGVPRLRSHLSLASCSTTFFPPWTVKKAER